MATDTWDAAFEAAPANGDAASTGDDSIRQLKLALRERLEADHSMAEDANDGRHKYVTLLEQGAAPANIADMGRVFALDVAGISELHYIDSDGTVKQITSNGSFEGITALLANFVDLDGYNAGQSIVRDPAGTANIPYVTKDHITGYLPTLNAIDASHDIDITAGHATDSTEVAILKGAALTKQIDTPFAEGTDAGLMQPIIAQTGTFTTVGTAVTGEAAVSQFLTDFAVGDTLYSSTELIARRITVITDDENMTLESAFDTDVAGGGDIAQKGGLAPSTTYYIFVIHKTADGTIDYYCDTSSVAANIPTDWAFFRQIGVYGSDTTSNIDSTNIRRVAYSRLVISEDIPLALMQRVATDDITSSTTLSEFIWNEDKYRRILITAHYLKPVTSSADFRLQLSSGGSYLTSGYVNADTGGGSTYIPLVPNTAAGSTRHFSAKLEIVNPNDIRGYNFMYHRYLNYNSAASPTYTTGDDAYWQTSSVKIDGCKIYCSTGNIESALITVEGIPA